MGLSLSTYFSLGILGGIIAYGRRQKRPIPGWIRPLHIALGVILVTLVLILLTIGIVGTLGEYGSLGHSIHLWLGISVVGLVLLSAGSASRIHPQRPWARSLHVGLNGILFLALMGVTWSGWQVVQKYLP
jgi:hypothetical protein